MANDKVVQTKVKGHGQGHMFKIYGTVRKVLYGTHMPNMKAFSLWIKKLWLMLKFFKSRSKVTDSWSRSHVQNLWYRWKGLVIRNKHAKYERPIS